MKKIVFMLGIIGILTGCEALEAIKEDFHRTVALGAKVQAQPGYGAYNQNNAYDRRKMSERIQKAYGSKEAKWDMNYENLMY